MRVIFFTIIFCSSKFGIMDSQVEKNRGIKKINKIYERFREQMHFCSIPIQIWCITGAGRVKLFVDFLLELRILKITII